MLKHFVHFKLRCKQNYGGGVAVLTCPKSQTTLHKRGRSYDEVVIYIEPQNCVLCKLRYEQNCRGRVAADACSKGQTMVHNHGRLYNELVVYIAHLNCA